jgi:transposase-like protein
MTKPLIAVITSVERRRRWSREDKERLVAACIEPGAVLSEIARAAGIHSAIHFHPITQTTHRIVLKHRRNSQKSHPTRQTRRPIS